MAEQIIGTFDIRGLDKLKTDLAELQPLLQQLNKVLQKIDYDIQWGFEPTVNLSPVESEPPSTPIP